MSHPVNDAIKEYFCEAFQTALSNENWEEVHQVMADTRDEGFEGLWQQMFSAYNETRFV